MKPSSASYEATSGTSMQAIVLAAGAGTRLRDVSPVKPLAMVAGRPMLHHVVERLAQAGITEAIVVVGYESDRVRASLGGGAVGCDVRFVDNPDWQAPNGVSVLAAAPFVSGRALLTMSDHLTDPALYARVAAVGGRIDDTVLGIDRRLGHPWIDEDDVTRVATDGDRIVDIGKLIARHDAYDAGTFSVSPALFAALRALDRPNLSDGMKLLAADGRARVADVTGLDWLDVDDARAFAIAEDWLGKSSVTLSD